MSQRVQQSCVLVLDVCYLCTSFSVFIIVYVCFCGFFFCFFLFCFFLFVYMFFCVYPFFFLGKGLILLFCIFSCNSCPFLSRLFFFVVYLWCICSVIIVNKLEVWWQYLPPTYMKCFNNYNIYYVLHKIIMTI